VNATHTKKKYWKLLLFLPLLALFIFIPLLLALIPVLPGAYVRLLVAIFLSLLMCAVCVYVLIVPSAKLYKHKAVNQNGDRNRRIVTWVLRIVAVPMLLLGLYMLLPLLSGSFNLFVLGKPFEIVSDQVIYVYSSSRYAHSSTECIYLSCTIRLLKQPNRDLEYMYAPGIQIGGTYEFFILPGSNTILASQ
jgi:hypothetical protein